MEWMDMGQSRSGHWLPFSFLLFLFAPKFFVVVFFPCVAVIGCKSDRIWRLLALEIKGSTGKKNNNDDTNKVCGHTKSKQK